MGRIKQTIKVDGQEFWTLFDTDARNTYIVPAVARFLSTSRPEQPLRSALGGRVREVDTTAVLEASVEGHSISTHAMVVDEIGKDEDGRPIEVILGALAMQQWGIRPIPDQEKLDLRIIPMSSSSSEAISWPTDAGILAARGPRNAVDPMRPYAFLVEPECAPDGRIEDVATLFLTNRECPFRCLFCDLWKNTTVETVPFGAIPLQIDYALASLPAAQHIKLYNSGNFFDRKAIPIEDHPAIAKRVRAFRSVIVENHPKLCTDDIPRFRDRLDGELEVAMGLETIHPQVLPRLNKRMTLVDFDAACRFLLAHDVQVRTFILLKPPGLDEHEGIDWALRSIAHAFDQGARCCSVIPTRTGNGIMEQLQRDGRFTAPNLASLESVLEQGIALQRGRVFVDLWAAERFATCRRCASARIKRMHSMNLNQRLEPSIECDCNGSAG